MFRVLFAALAVGLTALWLFLWRAPLGLRDQWTLVPNQTAWPIGAWLLPLGVVLIFGGAAALSVYDRFKRAKSRREQTNSTIVALVCLAIVAFLWPWALLGPGQIGSRASAAPATRFDKLTLEGRFNIIAALWSDPATEYFGAAYQITDARAYLHNYAGDEQKFVSRTQAHIATHPPGAVLWFYGARVLYEKVPGLQSAFGALAATVTGQNLTELSTGAGALRNTAARAAALPDPPPLPSSAVGGALFAAVLLGLSLVAAIPAIYGLAAVGAGADAERRGLVAVALWVLAPSANLFAFTLDAVVALGAVWTLYFAALAWTQSRPLWWIAAGVMLALTTFVSLGAVAVGVITVIALVWFRPVGWVRGALVLGAAWVASWAILAVAGGFNPLAVALQALASHRLVTLESRAYLPWIGLNLAVWMIFVGWPAVALLAGGVKLYRTSELSASPLANQLASGAALGVATIATLLLLSLSGNVRGEVERLWLFSLAPLCVLAASRHWPARVVGPLLGLQALQSLVMAATLAPLVRPF